LQNQDAALTAIDFEHFQAEISYGYNTGITPSTWAAETAYSLEDVVIPTTPNGYQYKCRVAGTSSNTGVDLLNDYFNSGDDGERAVADATWKAQTFTPTTSYTILKIKLLLFKTGTVGTVTASITAVDGSGHPTGADLCSGTSDASSLPTTSPYEWRTITLGAGTALTSGTKYAIVFRLAGGDIFSNFVGWRRVIAGGYAGGNAERSSDSGSSWAVSGTEDFLFETYSDTGLEPTFPISLGEQVTDGTVTWEMDGNQGDEYSRCAPLRCRAQELHSGRGILKLILRPLGILDQLGEDKATAGTTVAAGNTLTVQDWITLVAGATGLASYSTYTAVPLSYDSTDAVITTFKPAEYFAIRLNESRLSKVQELLAYTGSKMRSQNDGKIHIFDPVVSGTAYDYEYAFNVASEHNFWSKTVRNRFVEPNKIIVTSPSSAGTVYAGTATSATSFALAPKIATYEMTLASSAQANSIAAAKIESVEVDSEKGFAVVPMNVGQELWDWIKITDSRQNDTITGNIQYIRRDVEIHPSSPLTWTMMLALGRPSQLSIMSNMLDAGVNYSGRLSDGQILTMYDGIISYLESQKQQLTFIDETYITASDSSIPGDLDDLDDGTTYKRVLATAITAGNIRLTEVVGTLDDVDEGSTYQKILATNLSAGNIKLTSGLVAAGEWYDTGGVRINASTGIDIYGGSTAFRTYASATSQTIQCQVNSSGQITAAAGSIILDANGLKIVGQAAIIADTTNATRGYMYANSTDILVYSADSAGVVVSGDRGILIESRNGSYSVALTSAGNITLGADAIIVNANIEPGIGSYNIVASGDGFNGIYVSTIGAPSGSLNVVSMQTTISDVTGSRSVGTAYQPSASYPVEVSTEVQVNASVGSAILYTGASSGAVTQESGRIDNLNASAVIGTITKIVPAGYWYKISQVAGTVSIVKVLETTIGV